MFVASLHLNKMKTFCFLILAVLASIACTAQGDFTSTKKSKSLEFYGCIACAEDKSARSEYDECEKLLPETCQEFTKKCVNETLPESKSAEEQWSTLCKEQELREKVYDCVIRESSKVKEVNEEHMKQYNDFMTCAKKLKEKYCMKNA